eukprot:GDKI01044876.1.p1 GENE.GDKI01044876.1~~GDKI01044876.1.p1  ORF type:complete len:110 (-),score=10.57 GDKI01044876.1:59-388(-)
MSRSPYFTDEASCRAALQGGDLPHPAFEIDLNFFERLLKPNRGDWLASHKEVGQGVSSFKRQTKHRRGVRFPRGVRRCWERCRGGEGLRGCVCASLVCLGERTFANLHA